jgi:threonine dehydratase
LRARPRPRHRSPPRCGRARRRRSIVVSVAEIAAAIRLLAAHNRVIAEGAGAASVAAALTGRAGAGRVVCVVSGGNIDASKLAKILEGQIP